MEHPYNAGDLLIVRQKLAFSGICRGHHSLFIIMVNPESLKYRAILRKIKRLKKTRVPKSAERFWEEGSRCEVGTTRAHSIAVTRLHGMEQSGVRLPVGPPKNFGPHKSPRSSTDRADPS